MKTAKYLNSRALWILKITEIQEPQINQALTKLCTLKKAFSGNDFILQLCEFHTLFKFGPFQPLTQVFQRNSQIEQ